MTVLRITDDTPAETAADHVEARTRRLMAERQALPEWGDGRRERLVYGELIDDSLDVYNDLRRKPCP